MRGSRSSKATPASRFPALENLCASPGSGGGQAPRAPTPRDVQFDGAPAADLLALATKDAPLWAVASLDEVRRNLESTGYPMERIRFVAGPVEETVPRTLPGPVAVLRLDTDWYESTRHELLHLYPRLQANGILIIDDYGHWRGAREAADEYLAAVQPAVSLQTIDYTGVLAVKRGG